MSAELYEKNAETYRRRAAAIENRIAELNDQMNDLLLFADEEDIKAAQARMNLEPGDE